MDVKVDSKSKYTVEDLLSIMKMLRAPGGCPWDREQTHESIRMNFIEETYEAVEAIDLNDSKLLCEELGDVLLQIVFHSEMEEEKGSFDFSDVVDGICRKLIVRHPHVFSDVVANTSEEVLRNWDTIKMRTKAQKTQTEAMQSVSKALPALMRSAKVQKKAAKVGFDWPDVGGALEKVTEELGELKSAIDAHDGDGCREELGDLLFSVVNVSRFLHVDAEEALTRASEKFIGRFERVEHLAEKKHIDLQQAALAELDQLWDEAKKK